MGLKNGDFLPLHYDVELINKYYDQRPLDEFSRSFEIFFKTLPLISQLAADKIFNVDFEKVQVERAI